MAQTREFRRGSLRLFFDKKKPQVIRVIDSNDAEVEIPLNRGTKRNLVEVHGVPEVLWKT